MKFVDRESESMRLKKALEGKMDSFVVVWGRRRLGKSTLIRKVLGPKDIYFQADQSKSVLQRALLAKTAAASFEGLDSVTYPGWEELFRTLGRYSKEAFTLCLDEFPYLVEQSPELPSVLQRLLDESSLGYNIIICGSSQKMMHGLILDSSSPLYGHATAILKLSPLRLPYLQDALGLDDISAVETYSVFGGVPRYWNLIEGYGSLRDAVFSEVFSAQGTLYEEPSKILHDDMKDIVQASTILSFVGNGANRLSEIAGRCGEPATNLTRPLAKLIELGLLEKEIPFGENPKNTKKTLYKVSDPYMRFYYKFLAPNRSFIEMGRLKPIGEILGLEFNDFVANEWERLCRNAVSGNSIGGILFGEARRWWGAFSRNEQCEIDVVSESIDKKYLLVGECKWRDDIDSEGLKEELLKKAASLPFVKNHSIIPAVFLKSTDSKETDWVLTPRDVITLNG